MAQLELELITPERVALKESVEQVTLPTSEGEVTILPGHVPFVATLKPGELVVKKDNLLEHIAVGRGFLEVAENRLKIMAESAEHAAEIDMERAQEAIKRAEKLKSEATQHSEIAEATAALERGLARLKVAGRKHRHHSSTP